jgi:hypothetical protein
MDKWLVLHAHNSLQCFWKELKHEWGTQALNAARTSKGNWSCFMWLYLSTNIKTAPLLLTGPFLNVLVITQLHIPYQIGGSLILLKGWSTVTSTILDAASWYIQKLCIRLVSQKQAHSLFSSCQLLIHFQLFNVRADHWNSTTGTVLMPESQNPKGWGLKLIHLWLFLGSHKFL